VLGIAGDIADYSSPPFLGRVHAQTPHLRGRPSQLYKPMVDGYSSHLNFEPHLPVLAPLPGGITLGLDSPRARRILRTRTRASTSLYARTVSADATGLRRRAASCGAGHAHAPLAARRHAAPRVPRRSSYLACPCMSYSPRAAPHSRRASRSAQYALRRVTLRIASTLHDGLRPAELFGALEVLVLALDVDTRGQLLGALANTGAGLELLELNLEGTSDEVHSCPPLLRHSALIATQPSRSRCEPHCTNRSACCRRTYRRFTRSACGLTLPTETAARWKKARRVLRCGHLRLDRHYSASCFSFICLPHSL
jgi:hypothetical protein